MTNKDDRLPDALQQAAEAVGAASATLPAADPRTAQVTAELEETRQAWLTMSAAVTSGVRLWQGWLIAVIVACLVGPLSGWALGQPTWMPVELVPLIALLVFQLIAVQTIRRYARFRRRKVVKQLRTKSPIAPVPEAELDVLELLRVSAGIQRRARPYRKRRLLISRSKTETAVSATELGRDAGRHLVSVAALLSEKPAIVAESAGTGWRDVGPRSIKLGESYLQLAEQFASVIGRLSAGLDERPELLDSAVRLDGATRVLRQIGADLGARNPHRPTSDAWSVLLVFPMVLAMSVFSAETVQQADSLSLLAGLYVVFFAITGAPLGFGFGTWLRRSKPRRRTADDWHTDCVRELSTLQTEAALLAGRAVDLDGAGAAPWSRAVLTNIATVDAVLEKVARELAAPTEPSTHR